MSKVQGRGLHFDRGFFRVQRGGFVKIRIVWRADTQDLLCPGGFYFRDVGICVHGQGDESER